MRIIGGERKWDRGTRVRERGRRRGGRGNKGTNAKSILPKKTPKHTTGAHTHTQPHTSQLSNPRCCQCVCAYTCYTELSHCSRRCVPTWKSANTARTHRTTYLISKRIWGSLNGLGIATFMFVSVGFSISRLIFYIRLGRSWSPQRPATCKLLAAPMFSLPRGGEKAVTRLYFFKNPPKWSGAAQSSGCSKGAPLQNSVGWGGGLLFWTTCMWKVEFFYKKKNS